MFKWSWSDISCVGYSRRNNRKISWRSAIWQHNMIRCWRASCLAISVQADISGVLILAGMCTISYRWCSDLSLDVSPALCHQFIYICPTYNATIPSEPKFALHFEISSVLISVSPPLNMLEPPSEDLLPYSCHYLGSTRNAVLYHWRIHFIFPADHWVRREPVQWHLRWWSFNMRTYQGYLWKVEQELPDGFIYDRERVCFAAMKLSYPLFISKLTKIPKANPPRHNRADDATIIRWSPANCIWYYPFAFGQFMIRPNAFYAYFLQESVKLYQHLL